MCGPANANLSRDNLLNLIASKVPSLDVEDAEELERVLATGDGLGVKCDVFGRSRKILARSRLGTFWDHCDTLFIEGFGLRSVYGV